MMEWIGWGPQWSLKQELITFTMKSISKDMQKLIVCLKVRHTMSFCRYFTCQSMACFKIFKKH